MISNDFVNNGIIPLEFTCDGRNVSPSLSWNDVPDHTKSFALSCTDPDAIGGTWIHWLVCDIACVLRKIEKNSVPKGAKEIWNDFNKKSYGGPCPPSGTHRYVFTIFALKVEHLNEVTKHDFLEKVEKQTIEKATIIGLYKRK